MKRITDFDGFDRVTETVHQDPELKAVYEAAREAVKRVEPEPLPVQDALDRWNRIIELRGQWKELFVNWPKDVSAKVVREQLSTIRAEEQRLLAEIRGERTVSIEPCAWLAQKAEL